MWLPVGTDGCLELSPSKVQKSGLVGPPSPGRTRRLWDTVQPALVRPCAFGPDRVALLLADSSMLVSGCAAMPARSHHTRRRRVRRLHYRPTNFGEVFWRKHRNRLSPGSKRHERIQNHPKFAWFSIEYYFTNKESYERGNVIDDRSFEFKSIRTNRFWEPKGCDIRKIAVNL